MTQDVLQPGGATTVTVAGVVSVTATQSGAWSVSITGTPDVNVTDRAGRLLGIVSSITDPVTVSAIADPVTVATDPDADPLAVADDAAQQWRDGILELLVRQTEALERLALALT